MVDYKVHPAADCLPPLEGRKLDELARDIEANGQREPITLVEDGGEKVVLDGRSRLQACTVLGITPIVKIKTWEEIGNPYKFVASMNRHRRHLNAAENAAAANKLANLENGHRPTPAGVGVTMAEAAREAGSSETSMHRARYVDRYGTEEIKKAVASREMSLWAADLKCKALRREAIAGCVHEEPKTEVSGWKPRDSEKHETIRRLTDAGYTALDIEKETGIPKDYVRHTWRKIKPKKSPLAGAIQDAEVLAESWESRASNMEESWVSADSEEKRKLIEALTACCVSAKRVIRRLNKEAPKDKAHDEVNGSGESS